MAVTVAPTPNGADSGATGHVHDTERHLATCFACRLEEARTDLSRAHQRLRHLREEDAGG